jgi:hypothetical protein
MPEATVLYQGATLQLAEKAQFALKGHGFSRAVNAFQVSEAFASVERLFS